MLHRVRGIVFVLFFSTAGHLLIEVARRCGIYMVCSAKLIKVCNVNAGCSKNKIADSIPYTSDITLRIGRKELLLCIKHLENNYHAVKYLTKSDL